MTTNTLLAIIQQSEYDYHYIDDWINRNSHSSVEVKVEKWTVKLKLVRVLLKVFSFLPLNLRIHISLSLVKPIDLLIRRLFIFLAMVKLKWLKMNGLKVVAISGSYGKTSIKHILYHLLSSQIAVKMTPTSINTEIGIATYILKNLSKGDKLFVAELGEYYRGDISKLARFVSPDFGIIAPIGRQHLERMGDIQTIAKTILELENYFKDKSHVIIADENTDFSNKNLTFYGDKKNSTFKTKNVVISRRGTQFKVELPNENTVFDVFSPLYGEHQAKNTLPSFWLAHLLNLDEKKIAGRIATVPYINRRHEPTFLHNNVLILDNSYNTNPDSIRSSLKLIKQLDHSKLSLVTMGFTELGESSQSIHYDFGKSLVDTVDNIELIKSPETKSIVKGFIEGGGNRKQIEINEDLTIALERAIQRAETNAIILVEGGYREIYT